MPLYPPVRPPVFRPPLRLPCVQPPRPGRPGALQLNPVYVPVSSPTPSPLPVSYRHTGTALPATPTDAGLPGCSAASHLSAFALLSPLSDSPRPG